ncbi:unnamed protein product [Mytilus coruscus]|uniref:Uncharacterized protein n=1 Tax=Mytilus coruscus TaxID=42192 RepID=A0A6J8AG66_MYTCO|nr:unnamed protein product [Mytilus coruscus]
MGNTEVPDFDFDDPFLLLQALFENEIELEEVLAPIPSGEIPVEILPSTEIVTTQQPDPKPQKRFKRVSDEEILALKDSREAESIKRNTKWAVKILQEWISEVIETEVDFALISSYNLNNKLGRFYAETAPQFAEKKEEDMASDQANKYHENSFKSITTGIRRFLRDLNRDIDIVRDIEFRMSNDILDWKLKHNIKSGLSRYTKQKEVISQSDLYSARNPVFLRFRVWYNLAMHFLTRGLEFHQQLNLTSFYSKKMKIAGHMLRSHMKHVKKNGKVDLATLRLLLAKKYMKQNLRNVLLMILSKTDP